MDDFTAVRTTRCTARDSYPLGNFEGYPRCTSFHSMVCSSITLHQECIHLPTASPHHLNSRGRVSDTSFGDILQYIGNLLANPVMLPRHIKWCKISQELDGIASPGHWKENKNGSQKILIRHMSDFVGNTFLCWSCSTLCPARTKLDSRKYTILALRSACHLKTQMVK